MPDFHEQRAQLLLDSFFGQELCRRGITKWDMIDISKACVDANHAMFPSNLPKMVPLRFSHMHDSILMLEDVDFSPTEEAHLSLAQHASTVLPTCIVIPAIIQQHVQMTKDTAWLRVILDDCCNNLSVLDFSHCSWLGLNEIDLLSRALPLTQIKVLNFANCQRDIRRFKSLFKVLSQTQILTLDLSHCLIGDEGLEMLVTELRKDNCILQELYLAWRISSGSALFKLFSTLKLSTCPLRIVEVYGSVKAVKESFDISDLCDALNLGRLTSLRVDLHSKHLTQLQLALLYPSCNLTSLGVNLIRDCDQVDYRLCEFLQVLEHPMCKLAEFDLCDLEDVKFVDLVNALERPLCRLTKLVLTRCNPSAFDYAVLASMLKRGLCTLRVIKFQHDDLTAAATTNRHTLVHNLRHSRCSVHEITWTGLSPSQQSTVQHTTNCMRIARQLLALRTCAEVRRLRTKLSRLPQDLCKLVAEMLIPYHSVRYQR